MIEIRKFVIPINIRSLKTANIYTISNGRKRVLIDTGMSGSTLEFLKLSGVVVDSIDEILLTHLHFDHIGGAGKLQNDLSIPVNIGANDADIINRMIEDPEKYLKNEVEYLKYIGFPDNQLAIAEKTNPVQETYKMASEIDKLTPLEGGESFQGFPELSLLSVPGHTPGSMTYVVKEMNTAFTGDHVIEKITPNISYYDGGSDMLGLYMKSLITLRETGIETGYSGHGADIYNLGYRIDDILAHHKLRLSEIYAQCTDWLTPYEISARIRWNRGRTLEDMSGMERIFALGETLAHLRHLENIGLISKADRDGKLLYKI